MKHHFPQLTTAQLDEPATYFISDLHLNDDAPHITQLFIDFMVATAPKADAIYILGDFLDAWVGDDTPAAFLESVIDACTDASKHTSLYFLRGNRDFLVTDALLSKLSLQRIKDPSGHIIYGTPVILCHGDHLCGQDKAHQLLRRVSLSKTICSIFLSLPLSFRLKIAQKLRSENIDPYLPDTEGRFDVTTDCVQRCFEKLNTSRLIHGHTHSPQVHLHDSPATGAAKRYVLGCWGHTATILRWEAAGKPELLDWQ